MNANKIHPETRRRVDPILLKALNDSVQATGNMERLPDILASFVSLAKEYYPEVFVDDKDKPSTY